MPCRALARGTLPKRGRRFTLPPHSKNRTPAADHVYLHSFRQTEPGAPTRIVPLAFGPLRLLLAIIWSAAAERSGDAALASGVQSWMPCRALARGTQPKRGRR